MGDDSGAHVADVFGVNVLEAEYRGARLRLEFYGHPGARLVINGLIREERDAGARRTGSLKLSTTIQTDYEWHEFIEGELHYSDMEINARLTANNTEVASRTFKR